MDYLYLLIGFILLLASGHFLVLSASDISIKLNLPKMIIGLLVVSFGTSAPELLVSVQAALKSHPEIAMGNVVGSNIANIALVLGLTSIILPIVVKNKTVWIDWIVMMLSGLLLFVFSYDLIIEWYEGLIMLLILAVYILYSIRYRKTKDEEESNIARYPFYVSILLLLGAIIGMYFGADLLIDSSSIIAKSWGISERIISVTIIAFGTSVPELATSLIAALKKEMDISIGNIVGSNIFNILSILGITALIKPIDVSPATLNNDMIWMLGISVLLLLSILPIRKGKIHRWKGLLFIGIYIAYVYLLF
ncbi:MAG: calcium/sodium antiporter [Bacteroidales bacterium]|nr:calcium/sodium antiporter [Bacteroidales bacterium]